MQKKFLTSTEKVCKAIARNAAFERAMVLIIIFASLLAGVETFENVRTQYGSLLHTLDWIVLLLFVAEAAILIVALKGDYFRSGWHLFDFAIVLLCGIPLILSLWLELDPEWILVFRLARIGRALRLFETLSDLRHYGFALFRSLRLLGMTIVAGGVIFYIYSVVGVHLFASNDPFHWGDVFRSFTTITFRLMPAEDSADVFYTAFAGSHEYPAQGPIPVGPKPRGFGILATVFFTIVYWTSVGIQAAVIAVVVAQLTSIALHRPSKKKSATDEQHFDGAIQSIVDAVNGGQRLSATQVGQLMAAMQPTFPTDGG